MAILILYLKTRVHEDTKAYASKVPIDNISINSSRLNNKVHNALIKK
jgi:hypothetical protein